MYDATLVLPDSRSEQERLLRHHREHHIFRELQFEDPRSPGFTARGEISEFGMDFIAFTWLAYKRPGTNWRIQRWNHTLWIPLGRSMATVGGHGGSWYHLEFHGKVVTFWVTDQHCNAAKVDPDQIEDLSRDPEAYTRQRERFNIQVDCCDCKIP